MKRVESEGSKTLLLKYPMDLHDRASKFIRSGAFTKQFIKCFEEWVLHQEDLLGVDNTEYLRLNQLKKDLGRLNTKKYDGAKFCKEFGIEIKHIDNDIQYIIKQIMSEQKHLESLQKRHEKSKKPSKK